MAVSIRATTQTVASYVTSSTITIPAAVQAGDLLVLQVAGYYAPTLLAGWSRCYTRSGSNIGCFVMTKTAVAGDAGSVLTVSWSGSSQTVMSLMALTGGLGIRAVSNVWASSGGVGAPGPISALNGDMVVYLGANRSGGGVSTVNRTVTVDASGNGSTSMYGVVAHETLTADVARLQPTFTAPSGGSGQGYAYSVLVIAGVTAPSAVNTISLRDKAQVFFDGSTSTITIPATVQAGDYLVLQAVGAWAPTVPSGWSQMYANSGMNIGAFVATKTAAAGDAGSTVTVTWSGSQSGVLNLIALVTPGYGLRSSPVNDWASTGASDQPPDVSFGKNGDWVLAFGANRAANNIPTITGTTTDISGTGGTTAFSGIIAHEPLSYDIAGASYPFTTASSGNGYQYSLLAVASSPVVTDAELSRQSVEALTTASLVNRSMSRQSAEVLAGSSYVNRRLSRQSIEVLTPAKLRFRGWGVRY